MVTILALATAGSVAGAAPAVAPVSVQCTATGLKHFAPGMSADRICQRFAQAYGRASRTPIAMRADVTGRSGLVVELAFRPRGIASARAVQLRAGKSRALPLYELAVSDRKFLSSDIDRLAADVARGVTGGPDFGAAPNKRN